MALRFIDSFDHYATADIGTKWTAKNNSPTISANGRNSGSCLTLSNWNQGVTLTLDSQATWYVGFAFKYTGTVQAGLVLLRFLDTGTLHTDLRMDGAQRLYFTRNGTTIGSTSASALSSGNWYYIEVRVTISDAAGVAELWVNGTQWLNGTSLDTRNGANATANQIMLTSVTSLSTTAYFDDLYVCDSTGSSPTNTFLGDCRVEALLPSGAGATTAWTASAGSNYACVDEATPNGDTDYVSSSTANQVDTYAMGNLATSSGTAYGVQYLLYARKDDAGARSVAPVARISSTDYAGTTASLGDTFAYVKEIKEASPATAAAWTVSEINGMEYGEKLIS